MKKKSIQILSLYEVEKGRIRRSGPWAIRRLLLYAAALLFDGAVVMAGISAVGVGHHQLQVHNIGNGAHSAHGQVDRADHNNEGQAKGDHQGQSHLVQKVNEVCRADKCNTIDKDEDNDHGHQHEDGGSLHNDSAAVLLPDLLSMFFLNRGSGIRFYHISDYYDFADSVQAYEDLLARKVLKKGIIKF